MPLCTCAHAGPAFDSERAGSIEVKVGAIEVWLHVVFYIRTVFRVFLFCRNSIFGYLIDWCLYVLLQYVPHQYLCLLGRVCRLVLRLPCFWGFRCIDFGLFSSRLVYSLCVNFYERINVLESYWHGKLTRWPELKGNKSQSQAEAPPGLGKPDPAGFDSIGSRTTSHWVDQKRDILF